MAPPVSFNLRGGAIKSQIFGRYCQELMKAKFDTTRTVPKPSLDLHLRSEARQIVDVCYTGIMNIADLKWPFEVFFKKLEEMGSSALTPEEKKKLHSRFPPIGKVGQATGRLPLLAEPTVFADSDGVIGVWVLTGAIQPHRQEAITRAMKILKGEQLEDSSGSTPEKDAHGNRFFLSPTNALPCGIIQASILPSPPASSPSPTLLKLFEELTESFAVLGGILAVTNPWLFENALAKLEALQDLPVDPLDPNSINFLLDYWSSPFTTVELVCNRETLVQRNLDMPPWTYELVATVGAETNGRMECPDIGYRVLNSSGTVVVGAFRVLSRGIALESSEQVNLFFSFRDEALRDTAKYYNPKAPALDLWQRFYAN